MQPTRELPAIGLRFRIDIRPRWDWRVFAGVCLANGCDLETARRIAFALDGLGERACTLRPLKDPETFRAACKALGLYVEEIPPK